MVLPSMMLLVMFSGLTKIVRSCFKKSQFSETQGMFMGFASIKLIWEEGKGVKAEMKHWLGVGNH